MREAYVAARAEREQAEAEAEDARRAAAALAKRLEAKLDTAAIRCAVTHHQGCSQVCCNHSAMLWRAGLLSERAYVCRHCHASNRQNSTLHERVEQVWRACNMRAQCGGQ